MRGFIICILLGALAAANPVNGLTLYKCMLLDGSGVIYQDHEPDSSKCRIEKKEFDPDANLVPGDRSANNQNRQPESGNTSTTPSGAPDKSQDEAVLITGDEPELLVNDPANTPANEPAPADPGTEADSGATSPAAPGAGGAGFGLPGQVAPAGSLGP